MNELEPCINRYKIIRIEGEEQLKNTFVYVHTNPVALVEPEWENWEVKNPQEAINFLENIYKWTSYWDFLGNKNFPAVTKREFFLKLFEGEENIKKEVNSWIQFKSTRPGLVDNLE